MSQIIVTLNKFLIKLPNDLSEDLKKKVFDESIRLIRNVRVFEGGPSVEVLNLLIAVRDLGKEYLLSEQSLIELLNIEGIVDKVLVIELNYFQIMTILFYIKNESKYRRIRLGLEKIVLNKYKKEQNPFYDSELTHMFYDLLSCPFIRKHTKKILVSLIYKYERKKTPNVSEVNEIINYSIKKNWFINWSKKVSIEQLLVKKELQQAYA